MPDAPTPIVPPTYLPGHVSVGLRDLNPFVAEGRVPANISRPCVKSEAT